MTCILLHAQSAHDSRTDQQILHKRDVETLMYIEQTYHSCTFRHWHAAQNCSAVQRIRVVLQEGDLLRAIIVRYERGALSVELEDNLISTKSMFAMERGVDGNPLT